ncbi:sporulation protein YjcZ (plasmid) [Bacillus methanolicus]|nr:YjcZ family sporulation protein [Bacillus methanolicus]MDE3841100.1 sporulation protein YjcZ [Bacillus methanolicus]
MSDGYGNAFAFVVVLFVLLIIVGCSCFGRFGGYY